MGRGRALRLRIAIEVFVFFLIPFKLVPMLGALLVPLMAWISFSVFRNTFFGLLAQAPASEPPDASVAAPA